MRPLGACPVVKSAFLMNPVGTLVGTDGKPGEGRRQVPCEGYAAEAQIPAICDTETERWQLYGQFTRVALDNRMSIASPWATLDFGSTLTDEQKALYRQYILPMVNGTAPTRLSGASSPRS